jgi:AcrR family transcriptional regulator
MSVSASFAYSAVSRQAATAAGSARIGRMGETIDAPQRPGLRERTKARTRQELIEAAFALFAERGFEECTVEEIAKAADVSPRTFFRYFAVKEDVALAPMQDESDRMIQALAERPVSESPLTALREAFRGPVGRLVDRDALCGVMQFVEGCPTLVARKMALSADKERQVAQILGERMGVDPGRDPRPQLIATTFMAGIGQAYRSWIEDGMPNDLQKRVDRLVALLRGGLEG